MKTFYEMMMFLEAEGDEQEMQAPDTQAESPPESAEGPPEMSPPGGVPAGKGGVERNNYMFFSNLKAIKGMVEGILAMDAAQVDAMLDDGHDWASDHISTSRDDVEEVHNWLSGSIGEEG